MGMGGNKVWLGSELALLTKSKRVWSGRKGMRCTQALHLAICFSYHVFPLYQFSIFAGRVYCVGSASDSWVSNRGSFSALFIYHSIGGGTDEA